MLLQDEWQDMQNAFNDFAVTFQSQHSVMIEAKQSGFIQCRARNKRGQVEMQQFFLVTGMNVLR